MTEDIALTTEPSSMDGEDSGAGADGPDSADTAAARFKEIIGRARGAAASLREWEIARVHELDAAIADAEEDLAKAIEREEWATERATRWWKMAVNNVRRLAWIDPGDPPEPVSTARAQYLEHYLEEVRPSYQELVQSVLSLGWRAKRP